MLVKWYWLCSMHTTITISTRRHRTASSGGLIAPPCLPPEVVIQCRCKVGLSSKREDDQDDISSPHKVNDRMPGRFDNVGHCVLKPPE